MNIENRNKNQKIILTNYIIMEPLYYDINFLKNWLFSVDWIKNILIYLFQFNDNIDVIIINNTKYENFNINISEWFEEQKREKIKININNYELIIRDNIITDIYLNLSKFCELHIYFWFYNYNNNLCSKISYFYTIDHINNIEFKDIFLYIWESLFKTIDYLNPDNINMWEATVPKTISELKKWIFEWEYIYINSNYIDINSLDKHMNKLNYQKLSNWYMFVVKWYEEILSKIILTNIDLYEKEKILNLDSTM